MTAKDKFVEASSKEAPGDDFFEITPHDTNEIEFVTRGVYIGVAGDLAVKMLSGRILTIPEGVLAAGIPHPLRVKMVYATATTADDIYGVV